MGRASHRTIAVAAALAATIATLAAGASFAASRPTDTGHLWRISRPGVPDSYVLGTIHIADPRVSAPSPAVSEALSRCRMLAVEMIPDGADTSAAELEMLDRETSLPALLERELYARVEAALGARGVAPDAAARLKPWAAMMKLGLKPHGNGGENLDNRLLAAARARQMKIVSLELLDEQVSAFDAIPLASQVALLRHAVDHRDALSGTIEPTIDAWQRGDFRKLEAVAGAAFDPYPGMGEHRLQMLKHIIDNRTVLMHHRLFGPLRGGAVFVAIGAMHLPGPRGLLAMLRADGFSLAPVW